DGKRITRCACPVEMLFVTRPSWPCGERSSTASSLIEATFVQSSQHGQDGRVTNCVPWQSYPCHPCNPWFNSWLKGWRCQSAEFGLTPRREGGDAGWGG